MKTDALKTARLTLRPMGPEYLMSAYAYASDGENTRYMMFLPHESLEETRCYLLDCQREWRKPDPAFYEFAVLCGDAHIGAVTLYFEAGPGVGELAWVLHRDWQGRGYATEAVRAVMDFARDRLGIVRFFATCDAENTASQRVMHRLGLTLVDDGGTRKNRGSDAVRRELTYDINYGSVCK